MTVLDLDNIIQRLASLDLTDLRAAARERRNARRAFRRLVEQLPPGAVANAWDADALTLAQAQEAARWRHARGLAP